MTTFDANALAKAWLSVAVASGNDKDIAALYRTVSIESYPTGMRLVATDAVALLSSWVPTVEAGPASPEPDLDEVPPTTAVAVDLHGRGKGFLAHLLKLTSGEEPEKLEVDVVLGVVDEPAEAGVFPGLEATYVELSLPESEVVRLGTYEGAYPAWRALVHGFVQIETAAIALAPDMATRLGKLGKIQPGCRLGFSWSGPVRGARFVLVDSEPAVRGMVMPCRWDFERDAPVVVPDDLADLDDDGAA